MTTNHSPIAVTRREAYAPDVRSPDFYVQTNALKAQDESGDRPTVLATASSTAVDLEADRFTSRALRQMKDGFVGKLIFLNHSYKVPQDVFGVVESAELIKREGRLDLDIKIGVEMNNPLAVQTYQYITNGTRLGVSVGVIVTDAEKSDDEDQYGKTIFDIDGVIPLEASVVGIPANQTAWTRAAIKSLFERGAIDLNSDEIAARPWLKTVSNKQNKADEKAAPSKLTKDTRLWVTTDDGEVIVEITGEAKEKIMADQSDTSDSIEAKTSDADEDKEKDAADADRPGKKDDDSDATKSDDKAEKPEKSEEKAEKPEKSEEKESDDDSDATKSDDKDEEESDDKDEEESDDDTSDATKSDDDKEPDETKDAFEDSVAADEAASMLIRKMYTGLYVALDSLIPILMDTDQSVANRTKAGEDIIKSWAKFVESTWSEITDHLDTSKSVENTEINIAESLHSISAEKEGVECDIKGFEQVTAKVKEIADTAMATTDANTQLREELAQKTEAIKYVQQVIGILMELPLPTVTTSQTEVVAQSLAKRYPALDTRVVARMARFAPPDLE